MPSDLDVTIPAQVQQAYQFVTTLPVGLFALLGRQSVILDGVIVLIKPQHHRAFIRRVVRHEKIAAIAHKNTRRVEKAVGLSAAAPMGDKLGV